MTDGASFGRAAVRVASASEMLALEASAGKAKRFSGWDPLVGDLVLKALRGERPMVTVTRGQCGDTLSIKGLNAGQRELIDELFSLKRQQARGAWFLPEEAMLKVGLINLSAHFRRHPRYANGIAAEERGKIKLQGSPEVVLVWAVLEPLFERILLPLELRGRQVGAKERDDQLKAWTEVDRFLDALGLRVADELAAMRYGGGWSRLHAPEQVQAKQRLVDALGSQADRSTASRYRAHCIRALLGRYYERARKGPALRRQVVTKELERTLAGFFGGDWLAFLDYAGEEPHPDEQIATALSETRLYVGGTRASEVAAQQGLPVEEVERMLAAFWGGSGASPVERRVAAIRRYWPLFDESHARQAPGMPPLWGLVEDSGLIDFGDKPGVPYQAGLYRRLLPGDLVAEIEQLWGTVVLPRWPDRIVSGLFPHALMAEALGPALTLWHGCALTAWFLCEGPYSRTDMAGLAEYHAREVAELEQLGCPVDASLFAELVGAEADLGPPEPLRTDPSSKEVIPGLSLTMEMPVGTRRAGFERLRNIITRHRRDWTARHFEHYLRARWETELREAGRQYNRLLEEGGKLPTSKQFAKYATAAANHWFGGDISGLYGALGEKAPMRPEHVARMSADRAGFVLSVFRTLGGTPFERKYIVANSREAEAQAAEQQRYSSLTRLAAESLNYLQLEEALGCPPELKEFGSGKFERLASVLSADVGEAWAVYRRAIESVKRSLAHPPVSGRPPDRIAPPTAEAGATGSPEDSPTTRSEPETNARSWWKRLLGR